MITRPAARAGLMFEDGVAERILDDTGNNPGALALMAYALDELYRVSQNDMIINFTDYNTIGGVQGAIGKRAENIFKRLDNKTQTRLPRVFKELVEVDERGIAIRNRAPLDKIAQDSASADLINALTEARLLVQNQDKQDEKIIEVAHEALFRSWDRLAKWIEDQQDLLRLRRRVRIGAEDWQHNSKHKDYLLHGEILRVAEMWLQSNEKRQANITKSQREYIQASIEERLLREKKQDYERLKDQALKQYVKPYLLNRLEEMKKEGENLSKTWNELGRPRNFGQSTSARITEERNILYNILGTKGNWHPLSAIHVRSLGAQGDYAEMYKFPCCNTIQFTENDPPSQFQNDGCEKAPTSDS